MFVDEDAACLRETEWRLVDTDGDDVVLVHNADPTRFRNELANGAIVDNEAGVTWEVGLHATWEGKPMVLYVDCLAGRLTKCRLGDAWVAYFLDDRLELGWVGAPPEIINQLMAWKRRSFTFFKHPLYKSLAELVWIFSGHLVPQAWLWLSHGVTGDAQFRVERGSQGVPTVDLVACLDKFALVVRQMHRGDTGCFMVFVLVAREFMRIARARPPTGYMGNVHVALASMVRMVEEHKPRFEERVNKIDGIESVTSIFEHLEAVLREATDLLASWSLEAASALAHEHPAEAPKKSAARRKRSKEHRKLAAETRQHAAAAAAAAAAKAQEARARAEATAAVERALALAEAECVTAGVAAAAERVAQALRKHHDKCDPAVKRAAAARRAQWKRVPPPPDELLCPITLELLRDPVVLAGDGKVYEREAIAAWLARHATSPLTGLAVADVALAPCEATRAAVAAHRAARGK